MCVVVKRDGGAKGEGLECTIRVITKPTYFDFLRVNTIHAPVAYGPVV